MGKKVFGVIGSSAVSYIDHLVPLCQILGIPIVCIDPWIRDLIELYYPGMEVIYAGTRDYCLDHLLGDADALVFADHSKKCQGAYLIGDCIVHCEAKSVLSFHGNSDKKRNLFWCELSAHEDIVLLYGEFFSDFHKEKGVLERIPKILLCGNYRLEYYLQNKEFLQKKVAPFLFGKSPKKTILYAPTWSSQNQKSAWSVDYSSYGDAVDCVLENLPESYQVYVKTHPYHLQLHPDACQKTEEKYRNAPNIRFINHLPLIYPLLEHVDIYLGDYSSIGYDFLYYNRPMFFLNPDKRDFREDKGVYLYQCGVPIENAEFGNIFSIMEGHLNEDKQKFGKKREEVYRYAFSPTSIQQLKEELMALI